MAAGAALEETETLLITWEAKIVEKLNKAVGGAAGGGPAVPGQPADEAGPLYRCSVSPLLAAAHLVRLLVGIAWICHTERVAVCICLPLVNCAAAQCARCLPLLRCAAAWQRRSPKQIT